jgi:putative ABC transport system permease protein
MTIYKYIIRSIVHYRRQHLALFFGMAVSAAVLTGALIVGDSIRYSLDKMVDSRLGKTQIAIIGGSRFMDVNLAGDLAQAIQVPVAPVLMLQGIAIEPDSGTRVNRIGVIGIDSSFNGISESPVSVPGDDEAVIGKNLADRLNLKVGEELLVRVESANLIPVNAPFAREPAPTVALRLTVKAIATDDQLGRFNLGNDQSNAFNVFVSIRFLNLKLDLAGLSNTLLIAGENGECATTAIEDSVQSLWTMKDLGLSVENRKNGTYDLISNRIFIDTLVQHAISQAGLSNQEIITYLVNDIGFDGKHTPYSFASAVSASITGIMPGDHEVIINQWTAEDLGARIGDSVVLSYYEIGSLRELRETKRSFLIKAIINNTTSYIDSSLMPRFQGLSEVGNCSDWDAGVPIDLKRIRDKDEKYWDDFRGTPKVLLSLETGEKIWKNPFGSLTAIRFQENLVSKSKLVALLLGEIKPSDIGIQVVDVRDEGAVAAKNAIDFTELFLGMSFFIIVAGILLTVLIYSLHFSRRSAETALLSGLGFSAKRIIRLRFAESSLVILLGSIAGAVLGILYNFALIAGLNTVWNDMVRTDMLMVHVNFTSLLIGAVISILIAVLPIYRVTVKSLKQPVAGQLKGSPGLAALTMPRKKGTAMIWGFVLLALSLALVLYSLAVGAIDDPVLYLASAAFFLTGSLLLMHGILKKDISMQKNTVPAIGMLAVRNLQRNPARSLAVIALLAVGTFAIVLTGAYRKTFYGTEHLRNSGTGGYLLWAETTSPVPFNLNSPNGKNRLITESINDLDKVRFLQFERLEGDDASCLNLNQAQRPQLLAVYPSVFDSAGAFSFVRLLPGISAEHPWKGLEITFNDSIYPAYADQTVIQYSLKRKLGDTLVYLGESGKAFRLILAGSISNSIFQGNILISERVFRKQFPSSAGSKTILVDAPVNKQALIAEILSQSLVDYGIEITPTSQRLATFNSVENTYLTVFMALSGLGFIIGTIGLGIVLLRNVYERRQELALLLSLGYRKKQVFKIVFTENFYLLATGFCTGLLAAFVGILPSLLSPSFKIQGGFLLIITAGIFLNGLLWIYFPLKSALNRPLIPALRND